MKTRTLWILIAALATGFRAVEAAPGADRALRILETSCYDCHGKPGRPVRGKFDYILDRDALVARGQVIPGRPDDSPLYLRIVDTASPMPPAGRSPRPSLADQRAMRAWIESGAPSWAPGAQLLTPAGPYVTAFSVLRAVAEDLGRQAAEDRPHLLYFSIDHWKNFSPKPLPVNTVRAAFVKLVNLLSTSKEIYVPPSIDAEAYLYRVDMRRVGWQPDAWKAYKNEDPYFSDALPLQPAPKLDLRMAAAQTARADHFVSTASRGKVYSAFLRLPDTEPDVERALGVKGTPQRSGFTLSGTEANNRIIQRRDQQAGSYWNSYNFDANVGRGNIFAFPFDVKEHAEGFDRADTDIIYNLPNGLSAYLTVDKQGKKADEINKNTGLKCLTCHVGGYVQRDDMVRNAAEARAASLPAAYLAKIRLFYPTVPAFRRLVDADTGRYLRALEAMRLPLDGLPGGQQSANVQGEPINAIVAAYESELGVAASAQEIGIAADRLLAVVKRVPGLSRELGSLLLTGPEGNPFPGRVRRDLFAERYAPLVAALGTELAGPLPPLEATPALTAPELCGDRSPFPSGSVTDRAGTSLYGNTIDFDEKTVKGGLSYGASVRLLDAKAAKDAKGREVLRVFVCTSTGDPAIVGTSGWAHRNATSFVGRAP